MLPASEIDKLWETRGQFGGAEVKELAPVGSRREGAERMLDLRQQRTDLAGMLAPGESDAQAVAFEGRAEPDFVRCHGANLRGVQVRGEPLPIPRNTRRASAA